MVHGDVVLEAEGPGSYTFRFISEGGELFGRVTVGIEGSPDARSMPDQDKAARKRIAALSREFAEASAKIV